MTTPTPTVASTQSGAIGIAHIPYKWREDTSNLHRDPLEGGTGPDITPPAPPVRSDIVSEARAWLYTPYHKRGRIKGVGTDCGMFPYMVYRAFNLIPDLHDNCPTLEDDWFCHTTDQRYARIVERYFRRLIESQARREMLPEFLPGNLVLVQSFGSRVYNHGGIITAWPRVIHCSPDLGVAEVDVAADPFWANYRIASYDVGLPA
jgi:cell wall-associated NlpC family hydrolase